MLKKTGNANFGALGGITNKELQVDLAAADALFKQSRWDDAIAAYRALLEKAAAAECRSICRLPPPIATRRTTTRRSAAYEALLNADPANQKASVGIASMASERGDSKGAEEALIRAAQNAGAGREVFFNLGEVKLARKRCRRSGTVVSRRAASADPDLGKTSLQARVCSP